MKTTLKTQETIKVYVTARQYDSAVHELDQTEQDLEVYVVNNGKPLRPQIETLVKARLGQDWRVADWEIDEPQEEYEDEF